MEKGYGNYSGLDGRARISYINPYLLTPLIAACTVAIWNRLARRITYLPFMAWDTHE